MADDSGVDPSLRPGEREEAPRGQWIINSIDVLRTELKEAEARLTIRLGGIDDRIEKVENRLRTVERHIWIAIGATLVVGAVLGVISQVISYDFVISVQPKATD